MNKYIVESTIQAILGEIKGATAIGVTIRTIPSMRKTGNPFMEDGVFKTGDIAGILGGRYDNAINNQSGREDGTLDFVPQTAKWFEYIEGSKVIGHNRNKPHETYYFAIKVQSAGEQVYTDGLGEVIEGARLEELKSFFPAKKAPATQDHIEKKVIWRTIKLSSIVEMRINGETYVVCPNTEVLFERVKADADGEAVTG